MISLLAFLSGVPALVYEVGWTRQVALLAGGQFDAIATVLVAFFGGLALGAHRLGPLADRTTSPLRLYAAFELGGALLAWLATYGLSVASEDPRMIATRSARLALAGVSLLPASFLLGGTLPALLRAAGASFENAASHAGRLQGLNTAGACAGVALACLMLPSVGIVTTLFSASAAAAALAVLAGALATTAHDAPSAKPEAASAPIGARSLPSLALLASALGGVATLGYEVCATRLAALQLGSSLYAWGAVLALFLFGLALGNAGAARRAAATAHPARELGWLELAAAGALVVGLSLLAPAVASPARGLRWHTLALLTLGVLPAATLMGAAFPYFVRLAVHSPKLARHFGAVSAWNTAGGIAGSLLATVVLLPMLGLRGAVLCFAAINAAIGAVLLLRQHRRAPRHAYAACAALAALVFTASFARPPRPSLEAHVLYLEHGRHASAVVLQQGPRRDLVVDGDLEASNVSDALRTEVWLAALPLLLHPAPESFLELGLGSGITLATARRFPLARVECAEIAASVIRASAFFSPETGGVATRDDVAVANEDARLFVLRHPGEYDVIVANTVHPWSLGATGLYSREYYARVARSLRPGGIAVQWLPIARIGGDSFVAILRTFFGAFPHGSLWFAADSLIAVGSQTPLATPPPDVQRARLEAAQLDVASLGLTSIEAIASRRIAEAAGLRAALGPGRTLSDDLPALERSAASGSTAHAAGPAARLLDLARAQPTNDAGMLLWLEALKARERGDGVREAAREQLAAEAGLDVARQARAERLASAALRLLEKPDHSQAVREARRAVSLDPLSQRARLVLAQVEALRGGPVRALEILRELVQRYPDDAGVRNRLASALLDRGVLREAEREFARAIELDPYLREAISSAGIAAARRGDLDAAARHLARLRALAPLGTSPLEESLAEAIARR